MTTTTTTTTTLLPRTTKHLRRQGGGNDAPWLSRCDQCRKMQAATSHNVVSPFRPSGGGSGGARPPIRMRHRTNTLASYLIAALIAAAALSMSPVKSNTPPVAIVAAAPFHHTSYTRRGTIATTWFLTTEVIVAGAVPVLAAISSAAAIPPSLANVGVHDDGINIVATLAKEEEMKYSTRFLQILEDSDSHEADHDDHADHDEDEIIIDTAEEEENAALPWGKVIGATFLVALASLSGMLLIVAASTYSGMVKLRGKLSRNTTTTNNNNNDANINATAEEHSSEVRDICIFAFAAGALMATAVFLVLPEALHLIGGEHEAEHEHEEVVNRYLEGEEEVDGENVAAAKFGCAIMGGFLMPMLFGIVFHRPAAVEEENSVSSEEDAGCPSCIERDAAVVETGVLVTIDRSELELATGGGAAADSETEPIRKDDDDNFLPQDRHEHCDICNEDHNATTAVQESVLPSVEKVFINRQLCASILLGDSFHNFSDGMFIAASFKASCDVSTSVSIVTVTIIHEVAQELADFILLTRHVGLSVSKALLCNFLSGLSVVLGGIIFLACNPSDEATGVILGMAGGVYLNIAACETLPRVEKIIQTQVDRICTLLFFIIGTIPVGLVLLNHHHCG